MSRNRLGNRLSAVEPQRRRFLLGQVAALVLAVGLGALAVRGGGSSVPAVAQDRLGPVLLAPG